VQQVRCSDDASQSLQGLRFLQQEGNRFRSRIRQSEKQVSVWGPFFVRKKGDHGMNVGEFVCKAIAFLGSLWYTDTVEKPSKHLGRC
jgi:hypothetical protein